MSYRVRSHPIWPPPGLREVEAEMARSGLDSEAALRSMLIARDRVITNEEDDPFRYGWEPGIWKVCDAILGLPWCDQVFANEIKARFGWGWEEWSERMRRHLGFSHAVRMLLILGGNRSGKSEYSAKRCQMHLVNKTGANVFAFHMSSRRSIREQQPLFWKYMPSEWRIQTKGVSEYIAYKKKTGFSDGEFINPIGSQMSFLNYQQDRDVALEGIEADFLAPDELVPPDWVETMMLRLATRAGKGVITFTPINGYTPTVKLFCDSANIAKESMAYMLPLDGGETDEPRALGLSEKEYAELRDAKNRKRIPMSVASRPEDVNSWLEGKAGQPDPLPGRKFELMPRVMRSTDPKKAVVFLYSNDNPYGNPAEVIDIVRPKASYFIRERFYGFAEKTVSNMFPKFNRKAHVVPANTIPKDGTHYLFCDPAENRNFFFTWITATVDASYLVREWPSRYWIPGVGIPGPWAVPSGKNDGINDGRRDEGQGPFGFGLLRYKFEIARLEGWEDWKKWAKDTSADDDDYPDDELLYDWSDDNGSDMPIYERYIDSRAASSPRIENDRPVTLQTDFDDIGLYFELTPGSTIADGVSKINSALDYDMNDDMTFFNRPHFFIGAECENTIFSFENWLGVDHDKGACKDPVDNIRYYFTAQTGFVEKDWDSCRGGYYYGRGGLTPLRRHRAGIPGPLRRARRMRDEHIA